MTKVPRVGDLEIDQDLDFQRREWAAQRIGWGAMLLVVLGALAGVFGRGPLAKAAAGDEGGPLRLEYERITRKRSPAALKVRLAPNLATDSTVRVWLDRNYVEGIELERVVPEPEHVETAGDRVVFVFRVADPAQPAEIIFHIQPERPWIQSGRIGLASGPPLAFSQFVFP